MPEDPPALPMATQLHDTTGTQKCDACEWVARGGQTSMTCVCGLGCRCSLPECPWQKDKPEPDPEADPHVLSIPDEWKTPPLRLEST